MAALATEVKVVIEKGFGTWKVKLNVNILPFCVLPREGGESGGEKEKLPCEKRVDRGRKSTQRKKTRENDASRDRMVENVGEGRRGLRSGTFNVRYR